MQRILAGLAGDFEDAAPISSIRSGMSDLLDQRQAGRSARRARRRPCRASREPFELVLQVGILGLQRRCAPAGQAAAGGERGFAGIERDRRQASAVETACSELFDLTSWFALSTRAASF